MELSAETRRKYAIIASIANHNTPTLADIIRLTDIPESTVKRQIAQLRLDYEMDIRFVTDSESANKGRTGHYHILDWGVLDRAEFLVRFGSILEE